MQKYVILFAHNFAIQKHNYARCIKLSSKISYKTACKPYRDVMKNFLLVTSGGFTFVYSSQ